MKLKQLIKNAINARDLEITTYFKDTDKLVNCRYKNSSNVIEKINFMVNALPAKISNSLAYIAMAKGQTDYVGEYHVVKITAAHKHDFLIQQVIDDVIPNPTIAILEDISRMLNDRLPDKGDYRLVLKALPLPIEDFVAYVIAEEISEKIKLKEV